MWDELRQLATEHWVAGGIVTSLLWFLAGKVSFLGGKPAAAIAWQIGGVFVLLVMCGWAIKEGEWVGFAVGMVVLFVEVCSIKRIAAQTITR